MKNHQILNLASIRGWLLITVSAAILAIAPASRAGLAVPYPLDANTLHLWHFDEATGTNAFDSATNAQAPDITLTLTPGQVNQPFGTPTQFAQVGQPAAFPNLGFSIMTTQFSCFLSPFLSTTASGTVTNLTTAATTMTTTPIFTNLSYFINTNTGAFTYEALLYPTRNPATAGANMEILSGDSGEGTRAWQFRINNAGKLEYNNIAGTGTHDVTALLPTTGPDAANSNQWFHVAITFTGATPTNGDTPKVLTMYWTSLDPTRTNADVLASFTLGSGPSGIPVLAVGGSERGNPYNNVANSEGLYACVDEARISCVCRKSNEMAFNSSIVYAKPVFVGEPPASTLVGFGRTLTIPTSISGSTPLSITWTQNGAVIPGQTNATLIISNVTFAANGTYQCFATNNTPTFGIVGTNSTLATVTVGASFDGIYNTGVDNNNNPLDGTAPGTADLHYKLVQSPDPSTVNENAIIWSDASPVSPNGGWAANSSSVWIGPEENTGGSTGTYDYQIQFLVNEGDLASATLSGTLFAAGTAGGSTVQILLNGTETDVTTAPNPLAVSTPFTLTAANGLVEGSNVLDFVADYTGGPPSFRAAMVGIGQALPPGLPVVTNDVPDETVPYGGTASFGVVAIGRPPLTYQWYSNNVPLNPATTPGATSRTLSFVTTNISPSQVVGGTYTANYQVVISNDSGSVTSRVAQLTVPLPSQSVSSAGEPVWISANQTNITILFSQPVDPASASAVANYALNNGATIVSAAVGDLPNKVVLTTSILNPNDSYMLTVQNVNTFLDVALANSPVTIPVGIYPPAALWLKADTGVTIDSNNGVTEWDDQSGNGNNLSQTFSAANEPTLVSNSINGEPVVRFFATNETYMSAADSPSLEITGDMAIFTVVNFSTLYGLTNGEIVSKTALGAAANKPNPFDYYAETNSVAFLRGNGTEYGTANAVAAPSINVPHVMDVTMVGTTVTQRLDGQTNGVETINTTITDGGQPLYIGTRADGDVRLSGDIAELFVVGATISTNDVASMENYLGTKFAISFVNTNQPLLSFTATNSQLNISWPADHIGWTLQAQTNSTLAGVGSSWVGVPNSQTTNKVTVPINPANGSVYYRLIYP